MCRFDKAWLIIVDIKLFLVVAFGSHIWDSDRSDVLYMIGQAFRKNVNGGLGLRKYETIHDQLRDGFQEAMTKTRNRKLK